MRRRSCLGQKLTRLPARCGAANPGCGPAFQRVQPAESRLRSEPRPRGSGTRSRFKLFATLALCCLPLAAQSLERAQALWRAHEYEGANNEFRALVAANPKNANDRVEWGNLLFERFNPAEAANLYNEALTIDPRNARAYLGLAEVFADDFSVKANEAAGKALEIDPKLYHAHEIMARVALEDDDRKKAETEADAALAIEPTALDAIAIHASIDLLEDKPSDWVAKIGNRGEGYETIAHFFVINRRYDEGVEYYRKAIAATPDLWSAHSQLGVNLMRLGHQDEAYKELKLAYDNHFADAATTNCLTLIDSEKKFDTFTTPATILKLNKSEADALKPYFQAEIDRAMATYEKKYGFHMDKPVQVEAYPNHTDLMVRTLGLPDEAGILGVTFNNVISMDSPSSRTPGSFHWASTLWHEMSHVYVLTMTNERVPRWFTEGLAVHEETATSPDWGDRLSPEIIAALRDKKLLPISKMDRGFVHPSYPGQVIVSYYQAGKICDYIAQRWGSSKLVDMIHAFAKNQPTVDVIRDQLKLEPEQFDKDFLAEIDKETSGTVKNFAEWTKRIKEVNDLAKAGKTDEVIEQGRAVEAMYPDYVESGDAYTLIADACLKKSDRKCALEELGKYSKEGGRDSATVKKYAKLLEEDGRLKDAEAALERLNFIYPLDTDLHDKLGNLYLKTGSANLAQREFAVLVALHPIDQAGSHYNLAKAFAAEGKKDKAREEAINALESAPDFKPAQTLLLEVSGESEK
jgi:cellulose synthase operon protein C